MSYETIVLSPSIRVYQKYYPVDEILDADNLAMLLLSAPVSATISVGGNPGQTFKGMEAGMNFVSLPVQWRD
jgi:hypothetical protein